MPMSACPPDGDSAPRGESGIRGESAECERVLLARELEALGHGGCAFDLTGADDPDVVTVAYSIVQHLQENCGSPREEDQDLAERIQAWADKMERSVPGEEETGR